jgi:hypothetical protein
MARQITLWIYFLITVFGTISVFSVANIQAQTSSLTTTIFISEVGYQGTVSDNNCRADNSITFTCSHDKWLEIANIGEEKVDLSNFSLGIGQGSKQGFNSIQKLSGTLNAQQTAVIRVKNKSLLSLIDRLDVNKLEIANLTFMGNNQAGSKYLKLGLIENTQNAIINQISLSEEALNQLENSQIKNTNNPELKNTYSLNLDAKAQIIGLEKAASFFSDSKGINWGTPGSFPFIKTSKKSQENTTIVSTAPTLSTTPTIASTPTATSAAISKPIEKVNNTLVAANPQTQVQPKTQAQTQPQAQAQQTLIPTSTQEKVENPITSQAARPEQQITTSNTNQEIQANKTEPAKINTSPKLSTQIIVSDTTQKQALTVPTTTSPAVSPATISHLQAARADLPNLLIKLSVNQVLANTTTSPAVPQPSFILASILTAGTLHLLIKTAKRQIIEQNLVCLIFQLRRAS